MMYLPLFRLPIVLPSLKPIHHYFASFNNAAFMNNGRTTSHRVSISKYTIVPAMIPTSSTMPPNRFRARIPGFVTGFTLELQGAYRITAYMEYNSIPPSAQDTHSPVNLITSDGQTQGSSMVQKQPIWESLCQPPVQWRMLQNTAMEIHTAGKRCNMTPIRRIPSILRDVFNKTCMP